MGKGRSKYGKSVGAKRNHVVAAGGVATPPSLRPTWKGVCKRLRDCIAPQNVEAFLPHLALERVEPGAVVVVTADGFALFQASGPYRQHIADAFAEVLGRAVQIDIEERDGTPAPIVSEPAGDEGGELAPETPAPTSSMVRLAYTVAPFAQVAPMPTRSGHQAWTAQQGRLQVRAEGSTLPFGGLGRRLLVHLVTSVVRSGLIVPGVDEQPDVRSISIADHATDLVRRVGGKSDSGGAHSPRQAVLAQLDAILATTWTITEGRGEPMTLRLFEERAATVRPRQGIELTPTAAFVEMVRGRMVPVDERTLHELGRDCTALDLYLWATWRNNPRSKRGTFAVSLASLGQQLGRSWANMSAWGTRIKKALERIKGAYTHLNAFMHKARGYVWPALHLTPTTPHVGRGHRMRSRSAPTIAQAGGGGPPP